MPAPCNPWCGDVGDDLSFAMPDSCSACRDDDPKKLSSAQQSDDVSSIAKDKIITNIVAPRITRSGHTGIAARSLHQAGTDHVTTCIGRAALLLFQDGVHHADLLRLIGDIEASTSRLDRGLRHLFINLLRRLRRH